MPDPIVILTMPFVLPFIAVYQTGVKMVDIILGTQYSYHNLFWGAPNKKCNIETCELCNREQKRSRISYQEQKRHQEQKIYEEKVEKYGNPVRCENCGEYVFSHELYSTANDVIAHDASEFHNVFDGTFECKFC